MPEWIDSPGEFLTVLLIAAALFGGLSWLIRAVAALQHETSPNSGKTLRDAVDRIETKLDRHIEWHINKE